MNIKFNIEKIIIDQSTLNPHQRFAFEHAVEQGLTRLLNRDGMLSSISNRSISYINAGSIDINRRNNPVRLGHQIARTIYKGIVK